MELKEGYKLTDVGVIPKDWEARSISEISLDMLQGVNTAIDIPEYVESGIPMLKANNIIEGEIDFDAVDNISLSTYKGYSERFKIKKGDFLFSNIGARLGTGSLMKQSRECSFAWNVMRIIPNCKRIIPDYLSSIMNSPILFAQVKRSESGSGMGFVPKNILRKFLLPFPTDKSEQQAIASALNDTYALIASLEKLIAKKRSIKKGIMSTLLQPKEGWLVKKLGDVLKVKHGKSQKGIEKTDGKYCIFGTGGILGLTDHFIYDKPSVLIGRKGTIDKPRYIDQPFWTVDTLFYTEILEGTWEKFVFYLFENIDWYSYNEASGVPSLNAKTIEGIQLNLPPTVKEQRCISDTLDCMQIEIETLEKKLEKYKQVKKGLMQNLLTGKIRLIQQSKLDEAIA